MFDNLSWFQLYAYSKKNMQIIFMYQNYFVSLKRTQKLLKLTLYNEISFIS